MCPAFYQMTVLNVLGAFINEVNAMHNSNRISTEDGQALIAAISDAIDILNN